MADNTTISTAASALNQFLIQVKAIKNNESAIDLIKQIIDSPTIYSFSEFLESPEILAVNSLNYKIVKSLISIKYLA